MKTALIYKSKSGFTKSYVNYISQELKCDVIENKHLKINQIKDYDTIIYGGGLYVSGINGIKLITNNFSILKNKNIIVFFVGATPGREEEIEEVISHNFNEEQRKVIKCFYLRGGFDYKKLSFVNKILMLLLKLKIKMKKHKTGDEVGMLNAYSRPLDFTSKDKVLPLVEYIKSVSK